MTTTATIDQLKPGHEYPGATINSRTTGRQQDIEQLAASIKQEGLMLPLIVIPAPNDVRGFYVIDGNRRRAALEHLIKTKAMAKDATIDIRVERDLDVATALRKSLAANMHVPLHPVDQLETFAACIDKGNTIEEIAERFALTPKIVKQRLALGSLAPAVREAWRKGRIGVEAAEAYAATSDHVAQEKVLKRGGWDATNARGIRQALVGDVHEIKRLLKFVGESDYKAAGGKLIEDLFGEKGGNFADFGLLQKLTKEKLKGKVADYIAKGWGWAALADDLPHEARYSWAIKSNPKAEEKVRLGVVLSLDHNGNLEARAGVIKPGVKGISKNVDKSASGKKVKAKPNNVISNSLSFDLDQMAAQATKDALVADKYGDGLAMLLANIVASQITPGRFNYMPSQIRDRLKAIRDGITVKVMNEALVKRFDVKRYFPSAPKGHVIRAIAEAVDPAQAKKLEAGTKSAAWKYALANVPKTGWLPTELRTSNYAGPGSKGKPAKKKVR